MVNAFWRKTALAAGALLGLAFVPNFVGGFTGGFPLLSAQLLVPQITVLNIVGVTAGLWVVEKFVIPRMS